MIKVLRIPCIRPQGNYSPYPYENGHRNIKRDTVSFDATNPARLVREHSRHNIVEFPADQPDEAVAFAKSEAHRIASETMGVSDDVVCLSGSRVLYLSTNDAEFQAIRNSKEKMR